jgi:cytidine deaminase
MILSRVAFDAVPAVDRALIEAALTVRGNASAPYSGFAVGAALRTTSGSVYVGCNVEVASYSLTCCAERVAVFSAVADGERTFEAIAVVCPGETPVAPCGACRQVLAEFAPDLTVWMATPDHVVVRTTLSELLPASLVPEEVIKAIRAQHIKD